MHRSRLSNIFNKSKNLRDWENCRKQRHFCVRLRCKARKEYFNKLQPSVVNKNNFRKTFSPFFSEKSVKKNNKIILTENDRIISDDKEIAEIFEDNFSNVTNFTDIPEYQPPEDTFLSLRDPVLRAVKKYKHHLSILTIKKLMSKKDTGFEFKHFNRKDMSSKIQEKKGKKSFIGILSKILKDSSLRLDEPLTDLLNNTVHTYVWPIELGSADIAPTLEKKSPEAFKESFRPISFPCRIKSF